MIESQASLYWNFLKETILNAIMIDFPLSEFFIMILFFESVYITVLVCIYICMAMYTYSERVRIY